MHLPVVPLLAIAHSWRRGPPPSFRARYDHCDVLINLRDTNIISEDPRSLYALNSWCTLHKSLHGCIAMGSLRDCQECVVQAAELA